MEDNIDNLPEDILDFEDIEDEDDYDDSPLTRVELIRQISAMTNFNPAVVEEVLAALVSVAIEEIANGNNFKIQGLFSVKSYEKSGKNWGNVNPDGTRNIVQYSRTIPVLRARMSKNVKDLFRLQQEFYPDKPNMVNRYTWRDALAWNRLAKLKRGDIISHTKLGTVKVERKGGGSTTLPPL